MVMRMMMTMMIVMIMMVMLIMIMTIKMMTMIITIFIIMITMMIKVTTLATTKEVSHNMRVLLAACRELVGDCNKFLECCYQCFNIKLDIL